MLVECEIVNPPPAMKDAGRLIEGDPAGFRVKWQVSSTPGSEPTLGAATFEVRERVPQNQALRNWPAKAGEQTALLEGLGVANPGSNVDSRRAQWDELRNAALQDPGQLVLEWAPISKAHAQKLSPSTEGIDAQDMANPFALVQKLLDTQTRAIVYPQAEDGAEGRHEKLEQLESIVTTELNARLSSLAQRMARHIPNLSAVHVEPYWDFVKGADFSNITITRDGKKLPLQELGAGSLARTALAMLEWDAEDQDGIASRIRTMDEPDNRLHFDVQRRLIRLLRADVGNPEVSIAQCVVSTHSLTMVDATPLHEVVYIPPEIPESRKLRPLLTSTEAEAGELLGNIRHGLGMPASWAYLEKAIIVVEGATESNYIGELYFRITGSTLIEDGVRVWDSQGCGNAVATVKRLHSGARAKVYLVLDTDAKARKVGGTAETFEQALSPIWTDAGEHPTLAWLGTKELEDTWRHQDLTAIAQAHWPRADDTPWTPAHFAAVPTAEKPSDAIADIVRKGCAQNLVRCPPPTKETIGLHMGRLEGADHSEALVRLLRSVHGHCEEPADAAPPVTLAIAEPTNPPTIVNTEPGTLPE